MKIVLRDNVDGLGRKGDILDVSDGYARNYLVPKGLAMQSSAGAERQAAQMAKSREIKDAKDLTTAQELAGRFASWTLTIPARAGEGGKLFGSVGSADIVTAAQEQAHAEIDRRHLDMDEPIKEIGTHRIVANPHPEVSFEITVDVVAE